MTKKSKVTPPSSPYINARREWSERYGNFIATANNWRLIALGSLAVSFVAVTGLAVLASQHKIVPYAVEFDGNGEVTRVARISAASTPTERQMIAALRNWVIGARAVYTDPYAQQAIIDQTYAMTYPDSTCFRALSSYHKEKNPYRRSAKETVHVDVHTILRVSGTTWQVEWTETTNQPSGKILDSRQYQASISTVIAPPEDDSQIMVNPLGVYAQECSWTTRLQSNNY